MQNIKAGTRQRCRLLTQDEGEQAYLEARAEAEISLAQASTHPAAVRAHYLLAGYYLDRLYGQDNEAEESSSATA